MEIWKKIIEPDGNYLISNLGKVKNAKTGKILKCKNDRGYKRVSYKINGKLVYVRVHRIVAKYFIVGYNEKYHIDHINGDVSDNRVSNLRLSTIQENTMNMRKHRGKSKYKGVYYNKISDKWVSSIVHNKRRIYLGEFFLEMKAALEYDKKCRVLFGDRGRYNFPKPGEESAHICHCSSVGRASAL